MAAVHGRTVVLVASLTAMAAVWCVAVATLAGATNSAAVVVDVAAAAVLWAVAAWAPAGRPRWTIGLFAVWATATAAGDSWWLVSSGSPAVAYAHGQYEPAASVALFLARYPVGAAVLALALAGRSAGRVGPGTFGRALPPVQATVSVAAAVALTTPIGGFIADGRPYSLFFTFDVLLAAAALSVALRPGASRPARAAAGAVVGVCAGDGALLVALLEGSALASVVAYSVSLAGIAGCVVVLSSRREERAAGLTLPPAATRRGVWRLLVRVGTRLFLPVGVLVVSVHRLGGETALPPVHLGLVTVALGLALLDALGHFVRAQRDEAAATAALRDELTGAWSRRGLAEVVAHLPSRPGGSPRTWGLLVLDLDGFKAVNDEHGHAAGDLVLQVAVRRVAAVVGGRGVVARLGGDEFVVLVEDGVGDLPHRLLAAVSAGVDLADGSRCAVSTSIGAVEFDVAAWDGDLEPLLAEADRLMYRDKRGGHDDVAFQRAW
ncbi:GGDEF domain-containing protein [Kineococcus rhizosphaerae]|uniref:Diguanylate cyclase (GGDEF)-like protein n=1 Tax=Kineococcus rhizosphaerae TaxID=559628 RepID=A0A2T0R0H8_9ACTN|nr:GGDEF domain-containing protein [Kineococcus rhizosphaerae]PRY12606.1 diguanylate cyclase (GGDEF)-like protein [Kineococcus rhizosphaerae]